MYIRTDITGGKIINHHRINSNTIQQKMEQLSSGLRINSASDDAAGLNISERLRAKINENNKRIQNYKQDLSFYQTADGVLSSVSEHLQRMRELSVQGQNGTLSSEDIATLQNEMEGIVFSIENIGQNATFNGQKIFRENLLDDFNSANWRHIGLGNYPNTVIDANTILVSKPDTSDFAPSRHIDNVIEPGETYINKVEVENIDATGVGAYIEAWVYKSDGTYNWYGSNYTLNGTSQFSFTAPEDATFMRTQITMHKNTIGSFYLKSPQVYKLEKVTEDYSKEDVTLRHLGINDIDINDQHTITKIDKAINLINEKRSTLGSKINSLDFRIQNESNSLINESQAHSRITDADFAMVSSELVKSEIISQSNMSMLKKNIQNQQNRIQLLQG